MKILLKYSLIFILAFSSLSFQQQSFDPNAKVKAVFLYNFTKYFEWPEKMKSGNFIIQVVGSNSSLSQELNKMAASKQVGNQKLEIKSSATIDAATQPHIIFLLSESSDMLKDIATKFKGKGSLIVTEKTGLAKAGSAINFVVAENKQRFEYNENNAVKAGLKTGEGLNSLAIAIIK
ncbi:MAG: YfiR family protein [Bacteroidota bacterium]